MTNRTKRDRTLAAKSARPRVDRAKPAYPRLLALGLVAAASVACGGTVAGQAEALGESGGTGGMQRPPGTGGAEMPTGIIALPYEETGGVGATNPGPIGAGTAPYEETGGTPGAGGTSGDIAPAFTGGVGSGLTAGTGGSGSTDPGPAGAGAAPYEETGGTAGAPIVDVDPPEDGGAGGADFDPFGGGASSGVAGGTFE